MSRLRTTPLIGLAVLAASAAACTGSSSSADEFPSHEITWIVPYDAGGNTDAISRVVADAMGDELGQDVVVENKPGGSGAIGMQAVQGAEPDGHTLGLFTTGTMVVTPLVNELGYSQDDFTNIGLMLTQPVVFMTSPDSEYDSWDELAAAAKKDPEGLAVGVPGATTPQAYELSRMADDYDTSFAVVPFDSNAEIVSALRGGDVDAVALNASQDVVAQIESGDLTPLAVGEEDRLGWLPDTPTLQESGFDDLTASGTYIGLTAPADLPDDVRTSLEDALDAALQTDKVKEILGKDNIPDAFVGSDGITQKLQERRDLYEQLIG